MFLFYFILFYKYLQIFAIVPHDVMVLDKTKSVFIDLFIDIKKLNKSAWQSFV